jgi:hypothetical protein
MCVKERGSVQHLGSGVHGQLSPKADAWTALNILFPSITASGIPKDLALKAIDRLETRPRELYSGSVLLIDPRKTSSKLPCAFVLSFKIPLTAGSKLALASLNNRTWIENLPRQTKSLLALLPTSSSRESRLLLDV